MLNTDVIKEKFKALLPIFAKASVGDFSQDVEIPQEESIVKEIFVGVQNMLEVIREKIAELTQVNTQLEQKVAQRTKAFLEKEKLLQAILHCIGDGVVVANQDGEFLLWNPAAERIIGLGAKNIPPQEWTKIYGAFLPDKVTPFPVDKMPIMRAIHGESTDQVELFLRNPQRPQGVFASVTGRPLRDMQGNIIGGVVVFRDITKHKEYEENLKNTNAALEKEKEIDREKTEFVSLASHQLRTPPSTIKWYAEMLLHRLAGEINEKQKKYLEQIYVSSQRMIELTNTFLEVSRIELGTLTVTVKTVKIADIMTHVLTELKSQIQEKNLQIQELYEDNMPLIQADPTLLTTIFHNVLSNAVKYTPEQGKVEIAVSKDNDRLLIRISDSGYGIPKAQQSQIFTKLFRADNIKMKDPKGIGLGLYLTKAIVDKTGGTMWFTSEENKGTTFYISFPLTGMHIEQNHNTE